MIFDQQEAWYVAFKEHERFSLVSMCVTHQLFFIIILSMIKDLIANILMHNYKIIMLKRHVPPDVIKFYYFLF